MDIQTEPKTSITLNEIRKRKEAVREKIAVQKGAIRNKVADIFAPTPATGKWEQMLGMVNNGLAIYDGMMIGLRIMQRIRRTFKR